MACNSGEKYRIQSSGDTDLTANSATEKLVCTANKILDRLHRECTEKYTSTSDSSKIINHPSFYLRKQPKISSTFFGETSDGQQINGGRFNNMLSANPPKTEDDQVYRTAIHAIMNGVYNAGVTTENYRKPAATAQQTSITSSPDSFKGIYGLVNLNNVLEDEIDKIIKGMTGSKETAQNTADISQKYAQRRGIQTTLETIASRENEIYREKFLNLILIVVGIFLVGTQLVRKYFSFGGGGLGSDSGGGGGFFGNLFTGFGLGASSGIFSRFGGLGLGRSGRSRITGVFANNPYSLSTR